jgi:hypothetical protein
MFRVILRFTDHAGRVVVPSPEVRQAMLAAALIDACVAGAPVNRHHLNPTLNRAQRVYDAADGSVEREFKSRCNRHELER